MQTTYTWATGGRWACAACSTVVATKAAELAFVAPQGRLAHAAVVFYSEPASAGSALASLPVGPDGQLSTAAQGPALTRARPVRAMRGLVPVAVEEHAAHLVVDDIQEVKRTHRFSAGVRHLVNHVRNDAQEADLNWVAMVVAETHVERG